MKQERSSVKSALTASVSHSVRSSGSDTIQTNAKVTIAINLTILHRMMSVRKLIEVVKWLFA